MRKILRRGLSLSLLVVLTLALVSCDSGGSNSGPDWVGTWKEVGSGSYASFSKEVLRVARSFSGECLTESQNVAEVDGNIVTTEDGDRAKFEVSGDKLTIVDPSSGEEGDVYDRVDSSPSDFDDLRNTAGCE